ncbi:MAG: hypothetical protein Q3971_01240 [Moraxella sp.]|nr:hypothetical protein [Moraxella sp.]
MKRYLTALSCLLLVACAKTPNPDSTMSADVVPADSNDNVVNDEKLGTVWGDEINSSIQEIYATRKSPEPILTTSIRYADKAFKGKSLNNLSLMGGKITMTITHDNGKPYPITRQDGQYYLSAKADQSYSLVYQNNTPNNYEIISSVDGLDVLDGTTASVYHTGYVLRPHGRLTIEGFRKDKDTVASFTFGTPQDSYANHNTQGNISNVGIIGVAVYELDTHDSDKPKKYAPPPTDKPQAFPASVD